MGWFGNACRAVGRAIGNGISSVGRAIGSKTVEKIGDGISYACREVEKTAKRTSETESYDKESSRVSETQRINAILSEFSTNLQQQADEIEDLAIKESQVYFDELISNMEKINFANGVKINICKIKRELNRVNRNIRGSFKHHLAKRVSLDDNECLNILKMDSGSTKENAMKKFGNKVLQEARVNLCDNIKDALVDQQEYITDEINEKLDDVILNLKNLNTKVKEFEKIKQTDTQKIETEKISCIQKIQSADYMLNILS